MLRTVVALALLVVLMGVTGAREAYAGNFLLVDTTSDANLVSGCQDETPDGDCSLRGAITISNTIPGLKALIFNVGTGVPTIVLLTPLPAITQPVLMDGATGGATAINIYGTNVQSSAGLDLETHSGSTIKHMEIYGFSSGTGILIRGGGDHTIVGNLIGTTGTQAVANLNGVVLQDTTNNTIGGDVNDKNVISGNIEAGVLLDSDADNNIVAGNSIGVSADWSIVMPNHEGVSVSGLSSGNQIGTSSMANVIAGNTGNGVLINGTGTQVRLNLIGVNPLAQAKPNGENGIFIGPNATGTVIGGSLDNRNVISGNALAGVHIQSGAGVDVSGNIIGLNAFGNSPVPNQGAGIEVVQTTDFTTAGVAAIQIGKPGAGNTISGNTGVGIKIDGVNGVSVRGNNIGVSAEGDTGFGNGFYGIDAADANGTTIADNFIAAHSDAGIFIHSRLIRVAGGDILNNWIGGKPDIAGNGAGIQFVADSGNMMNNTIVDNVSDGISIAGDDNFVGGNLIGTNSEGDDVGNGGDGVAISGDRNLISRVLTFAAQPAGGPLFPLGANIIWNNGGSGVFVSEGVGNTINQNSMVDNVAGAIDLAPEGPTSNDTDDPDQGANTLQNYPVLTAAGNSQTSAQGIHPSGGGGILQGSLNSTPNTEFLIDVYTQDTCNISNLQPAEDWIGSFEVTTNGNGDVQFSQEAFTDMQPGAFINATATNPTGSTSELSDCIQATANVSTPTPTPGPSLTPTPTPGPTNLFGDADCSGVVDIDDFIAALSEVAGVPPGTACPGNVGCEDPIDAQDALDILKYVASPADYPLPLC